MLHFRARKEEIVHIFTWYYFLKVFLKLRIVSDQVMDPFVPREGPSPDNPYTIFRKNPLKLLGFPFLLPPEFHEKKESLEYALLRAEEGRFTAYQHKFDLF